MKNIDDKILTEAMLVGAWLCDDGDGETHLEITENALVAFVKAFALAAIHDSELQRELMEDV